MFKSYGRTLGNNPWMTLVDPLRYLRRTCNTYFTLGWYLSIILDISNVDLPIACSDFTTDFREAVKSHFWSMNVRFWSHSGTLKYRVTRANSCSLFTLVQNIRVFLQGVHIYLFKSSAKAGRDSRSIFKTELNRLEFRVFLLLDELPYQGQRT